MASTSAPRARSSDFRVVCASPSPEKAISTRHASDASSAESRALAARPSAAAPAGGVAATVPPNCRLRTVCWETSAPAQTGAATPLPRSVRSSEPGATVGVARPIRDWGRLRLPERRPSEAAVAFGGWLRGRRGWLWFRGRPGRGGGRRRGVRVRGGGGARRGRRAVPRPLRLQLRPQRRHARRLHPRQGPSRQRLGL
eukprot:6131428-Pleurochrysis_carterae.AAC.1